VNECSRFFVRHGNIDPAMHAPRALSDRPPVIGPFHTSPRPPRGYRTTTSLPADLAPSNQAELSDYTIQADLAHRPNRVIGPSHSCRSLPDWQENIIGPKDFLSFCLHPRGLNCTLWVERIGDSAGDRDDEHPQHNRDRSKLVFGRSYSLRFRYRGDRCYRMHQRCFRDAVSRLISDARSKL